MYGDAERRPYSRAAAPAPPAAPPDPPPPPVERPAPPPEPEPQPETLAQSLVESVTPEPDTSLEIESTNLAEQVEVPAGEGNGGGTLLEGLETTSAEFGEVDLDGGEVPSLRDEVTPEPVQPMAQLEPTVPPGADETELEVELEPMLEHEIEIEPPPPPTAAPPNVAPVPPTPPRRPGVGAPPRVGSPKPPGPALHPRAPEPPKLKPVVPKRPATPAAPPAAPERPTRKAVVEVPPLELEPDFDTASTEAGHDVDDQPLAVEDIPPTGGFIQTEEDTSISETRRSAFIDLGLDGVVTAADAPSSLVFTNIEATPAPPDIDQLEALVADDPDDPEAHRALGEALIEAGERDRGIEELDHATAGLENLGNLPQAQHLGEEILRLDPNSVRHRQKQVEYAFKSGDKAKLVDAYLELADTLLRQDLPDKARAVYQRVAEHDAKNERAKAALAMLAPAAASPPEPPPAAREQRTAPKDAKMKVRDEAAAAGDFVDLSAMILEEDPPVRDTRMKVADEEPTGDEEKDFQEMLTRFKQGIDENIDEADFQSHYDLGVAFKEMGLLDEAIAELQKALRAPEGKLRTSEMLGICFFEKGAYGVAESILRRGLDLPAHGDQERLGVLYWLGRALEQQGKKADARDLYGRVFAVDIRFLDAEQRVKALAKAK